MQKNTVKKYSEYGRFFTQYYNKTWSSLYSFPLDKSLAIMQKINKLVFKNLSFESLLYGLG